MTDNLMPKAELSLDDIEGEQWERDLASVRAPVGLRDLLERIDVAALSTSDRQDPDTGSREWMLLLGLLVALTLVTSIPDDLPHPDVTASGDTTEEVRSARQLVAYVRDLLEAIKRRQTAENSMGLWRYIVATADMQDLADAPGSIDLTARTRQMHLAWEYAHGKDENGKPWSIAKLGDRVGLTKARAQQLIDRGRAHWTDSDAVLPR